MEKGTAGKEEIEQFLRIFKSCWNGKVVPRSDSRNDDTLAILGIVPKHRTEEVKKLRYDDYYRGPSPDHDGDSTKEWWEFGRWIDGYEIYIKIRVYKNKHGQYEAKCMSFHIADRTITYPFKKE
jgi:hypothetical protein